MAIVLRPRRSRLFLDFRLHPLSRYAHEHSMLRSTQQADRIPVGPDYSLTACLSWTCHRLLILAMTWFPADRQISERHISHSDDTAFTLWHNDAALEEEEVEVMEKNEVLTSPMAGFARYASDDHSTLPSQHSTERTGPRDCRKRQSLHILRAPSSLFLL